MAPRWKVLARGIACGVLVALAAAGLMVPSEMSLSDRALIFATVLGGPAAGLFWGLSSVPIVIIAWVGMCLILLHPVRPNQATGFLSRWCL